MIRILLIEDDDLNRDILTRRLTLRKFEVTLARDGQEGLDKALEWGPDLIITDIFLPNMSGTELCRLIRASEDIADTPIIAISAQATEEGRKKCLAAGCDVYIPKPVNMNLLAGAIHGLLTNPNSFRESPQDEDDAPREIENNLSRENIAQFAKRGGYSLREYLGIYTDKITREATELEKAIADHDPKRVSYCAHCCAGYCLACGANRLGKLLREIEITAEKSNLARAESLMQDVTRQLATVIPTLQRLTDEHPV